MEGLDYFQCVLKQDGESLYFSMCVGFLNTSVSRVPSPLEQIWTKMCSSSNVVQTQSV